MQKFRIFQVSLLFSLLFMSLSINAQQMGGQRPAGAMVFSDGKVFGRVLDSQDKGAIEYSNVVLFRYRDSTMVTGTVTDKKGQFSLDKLTPGKFYAKISFIGFETIYIDSIFINPRSKEANLGDIYIKPTAFQVQSVVVTGEQEMIQHNLDKKVINVDKNIASSGGNALDVMQNVPSITVDADGGVKFRNNSNLKILIDGRPGGTEGLSASDILQQLPASTIESIELVTNPSARYDPEGTAGIINIITKKKSNIGVNGVFSLNAGTGDKYNTSMNLNLRGADVNIYGSYDTRFNKFDGSNSTLRSNFFSSGTSQLNQSQFFKNDMGMQNVSLGTDWFIDGLNTLGFNFKYRTMDFGNKSILENQNLSGLSNPVQSFTRNNISDRNHHSFDYSLFYKKTYDTKGRELTLQADFDDSKMQSSQNISQNFFQPAISTISKANTDNKHRMYTAELNYIDPIQDFGRIETGAKYTNKNLNTRNEYFNLDSRTSNWNEDISLQNYFDYKEQNISGWGIYSNIWGGLKYQAGVRLEQVIIDASLVNKNDSFDNDYFSVYPSAHLSYDFGSDYEGMFSYSRRVDRPNNRQLNPYIDYSDSLNIFQGNPKLNPQYINSLELGLSKFIGKTSLSSTVFFKETNDVISTISTLMPNGVTYSTFKNISHSQSYGAEFVATTSVWDWWKVNANVSIFKTILDDKGVANINVNSNSWTAKFNSNMNLPAGIVLQLIFNYNSPSYIMSMGWGGGIVTAQSRMKETYFADMALRKDFMNGNLSVTLRLTDLFNSRKFDSETTGLGFLSNSTRRMDSRNIYLGVSYRLNPSQQDRNTKPRQNQGDDQENMF